MFYNIGPGVTPVFVLECFCLYLSQVK